MKQKNREQNQIEQARKLSALYRVSGAARRQIDDAIIKYKDSFGTDAPLTAYTEIYLNQSNVRELSEKLFVHPRTVYKWAERATERMAVFLFDESYIKSLLMDAFPQKETAPETVYIPEAFRVSDADKDELMKSVHVSEAEVDKLMADIRSEINRQE